MSQDDLGATARRFLQGRSGVPALRLLEGGAGHDPTAWSAMVDLGWPGLGVRPELGGAGGSLADVAVVAGELGRAAWPGPLLGTWGALDVLQACGAAHEATITTALADGWALALVAPTEPVTKITCDDGHLGGPASIVEWAAEADLLVVVADCAGQPDKAAVALLAPTAEGLGVVPERSLDNERVAVVGLDAAPVAADALAVVDRTVVLASLQRWLLLRAALMIGGAEAVLELTTEHVLSRHQFGRPLAGFQAVRHMAADAAMAVDGARLLLADALRTRHEGLVAAAGFVAGRAYSQVVISAAQLHGGVGVTDEHILPQHFRRAEAMRLRAGSERTQLEAVATGLIGGGPVGVLGPAPSAR